MAIVEGHGLPISVMTASASPHEATLAAPAIAASHSDDLPNCLIGDKAYDSDRLDEQLWRDHGIELISPHRRGRQKPATQDGRALRRYVRRWKVERFFSWIQWQRRVTTRWDIKGINFLGWVQLASILVLANHL